jgi:hypothetical protein
MCHLPIYYYDIGIAMLHNLLYVSAHSYYYYFFAEHCTGECFSAKSNCNPFATMK